MKVVFFGTPYFSAEILKFLIQKNIEIAAVVTQPDKPQGRHLQKQQSAVKRAALELLGNVPIFQPEKIRSPDFQKILSELSADVFVVVAFGQIFPQSLLDLPPKGCVNVHTSLLPLYRGAAPIERCLMDGVDQTGVSIMYMVKELDAGDVISQKTMSVDPDMNALELTQALCHLSKDALHESLEKINDLTVTSVPQDHQKATFAPKVLPIDAQIFWGQQATSLYNIYRAVTPKPGAWCYIWLRGKKHRLKIIEAKPLLTEGGHPGVICEKDGQLVVACREGAFEILQLQLEGKKKISSQEFLRGYQIKEVSFSEIC